jgi:hypothetical protein
MTTPRQRTDAVIQTRDLLRLLARTDEVTIRGLIESVAMCLLRHYPLDIDLEVSAAALPGIWAAPEHRRPGSAREAEFQRGIPGQHDADDARNSGSDDGQSE